MKKDDCAPEYLKDEYTTLDVKDDAKYQEIALLVDRVDFIDAIRDIRQELYIVVPPQGQSQDLTYLTKDLRGERLIEKITLLLAKLQKPAYLHEAAVQATLSKSVLDNSGIVRVLGKGSTFNRDTIGIFPLSNTSLEELEKAWEVVQSWYEKNNQLDHKNVKSEFKTHREWYWRWVRGETYKEIALSVALKEGLLSSEDLQITKTRNINRDIIPCMSRINAAMRIYKKALS